MNYNKTIFGWVNSKNWFSTRHTHNTRQLNNIVNINCRTSLYSEFFLPSTIQAWNDLPLTTRNLESPNSFKSLINNQSTNVPAHYMLDVGKVRYHLWLRIVCTFLCNLQSRARTHAVLVEELLGNPTTYLIEPIYPFQRQ
jgi:hypothetical protein